MLPKMLYARIWYNPGYYNQKSASKEASPRSNWSMEMVNPEARELFDKGKEALDEGNILSALTYLEKASKIEDDPSIDSSLAFCIAKERGHFQRAISLCAGAIEADPQSSSHYLNLGRIYLLEKKKKEAIDIFREGLHYEENREIINELCRLGTRRPSVIPFLKRNNVVNKYLGIILSRLRLR